MIKIIGGGEVSKYFPLLSNIYKHYDIKPKSYLEIGVCEGYSIACMIEEFPELEKVILSDTWLSEYGGSGKGSHNHIVELLEEFGFDLNKVTFLDGDSKDTIPKYFEANDEVFDLLYIDGDHSYLGCTADIVNCINHCNICAIHDVRHPTYPFIKELCYSFYDTIKDDFFMIDNGEYIIYFVRKNIIQKDL